MIADVWTRHDYISAIAGVIGFIVAILGSALGLSALGVVGISQSSRPLDTTRRVGSGPLPGTAIGTTKNPRTS
jgi:hypothetical protein